jgi:hypothetical protein
MIRDEGYQALSDLIYKGFLLTGLKVAGKSFVFKTINEREYKLIKLYSGFEDDKSYASRFNMNYLIYSLFLAEGENILIKREEEYRKISAFFYNMPNILCSNILTELMTLRDTALEAVEYIEGFSYTSRSRRVWRQCNNNYPNNEAFTGIPGTNKMGLNVYQENWMLINKMLDEEERYNKDFSMSLFVASAYNPKGVRSVRSKFESNQQLAEKRRKRIARLGSIKKQEWSPEKWSAPVDTAEELVAELMRQMSGKKDRHDRFIEKHMDKIRQRAEEKTRKVEERLEEIRKRRPEDIIPIAVSQRPLTPEEAEKLESRKINNLVIVNDQREAKEKEEERVYKKIGSKVLTGRK